MASEKITAIIDSVKELSVLELKELIDAYCEEFGVSAVAAAAPAAAGSQGGHARRRFRHAGPLFASQQVAGVPVREMFTDQLVQLQLEGAVL